MVPDGDGLQGRETSRQQVRVNLVQSLAFVDTEVTQGGVGLPTGESILFDLWFLVGILLGPTEHL